MTERCTVLYRAYDLNTNGVVTRVPATTYDGWYHGSLIKNDKHGIVEDDRGCVHVVHTDLITLHEE
jgi:hypothetical protein